MSNKNLNFPYYFYPNIPFCGYMNTKEYNQNLIKLNELLLEISLIQKPILLHITIGAPAEEILAGYTEHEWYNQWIQLYPSHLNTDVEIIHIIISPNKYLSSDPSYCEFKTPTFIRMTSELNWINNNNVYRSKVKPITVYIFYTMMPTVDERNTKIIMYNTSRFENICKSFHGVVVDQYLIGTYIQTEYDVEFVRQFYQNLKHAVNAVKDNGGVTTCFSFAVFCETTNKFSYGQNYNMFQEITCVGCNLLAEWRFVSNNYKLLEYYNKKMCSYDDDSISIIKDDDDKLTLQCNFLNLSPKRKFEK